MRRVKKELSKVKGQRLIAIVCLDEKNFILHYFFDKEGKYSKLSFKIPKKKPIVESIVDVYPSADYYEREIHDFFGVEFEGNPKLHTKLFVADDYRGKPPMLKKVKK